MRTPSQILCLCALCGFSAVAAQDRPVAVTPRAPTAPTGDYASDVGVVLEAQAQALEQAKTALEKLEGARERTALETAMQEMQRAQAALAEAKKSADKLPAALSAEQAAYQALLKATPRDYRVSRSRNRSQNSQGSGSQAGQPGQDELNQLEMTGEENRYETERQASATPTPQQREQTQTVDRLKQLARRQQDLNERLRDLQTALQEAPNQKQREDIQQQLKRLREEERQLLSDVDQMRQQMEQSSDGARQADARQQLEQTRSEVQRAAQNLEQGAVSEALAAGSRAEQRLQNLRENLRQQTSSQFAEQMRQMRSQARDLANREADIAKGLEALNNSSQKSLDDSAPRKTLTDQLAQQQRALTNIVGQMRNLTEQAETTEPILSKQLYEVVRKADQSHTDNQLDLSERLVDRGFLPQASQAERGARQNIDELRQGVERAAESVLGSEADALRYAQRQLDDLANQLAGEATGGTNQPAAAGPRGSDRGGTNAFTANSRSPGGTNAAGNAPSGRQTRTSQGGGSGPAANQVGGTNQAGQTAAASGESQSARSPGQGDNPGENQEIAQAGPGQADEPGNQPGEAGRQGAAQGGRQGQRGSQPGRTGARQNGGARSGQTGEAASQGERREEGAEGGGRDRLRQIAQDIGNARNGLGWDGPITGNNFVDWNERMRDVEQAIDSQDVRNQLATVRERVATYRREFRERRHVPSRDEIQNKAIEPLTLARNWIDQELSRAQNEKSLAPLDRDPVPEKYADLVRQYYEKLGSGQ